MVGERETERERREGEREGGNEKGRRWVERGAEAPSVLVSSLYLLVTFFLLRHLLLQTVCLRPKS